MSTHKSLIILSQKSSGSSILQNELTKHPDIHHAAHTQHYENETLYWIKAACLLEFPKETFYDNHIAYTKETARAELLEFITANCPNFDGHGLSEEALIDAGWQALSQNYGPIFLEKSPRHLQNRSALDAMLQSFERQGTDFLLIGLIRHPMAVLYSMWDRWKSPPNYKQWVWIEAAKNLQYIQKIVPPENLITTRYEDMVENPEGLMKEITGRLGVPWNADMGKAMHRKSTNKWKNQIITTKSFLGFPLEKQDFEAFTALSPEASEMAHQWAYDVDSYVKPKL